MNSFIPSAYPIAKNSIFFFNEEHVQPRSCCVTRPLYLILCGLKCLSIPEHRNNIFQSPEIKA